MWWAGCTYLNTGIDARSSRNTSMDWISDVVPFKLGSELGPPVCGAGPEESMPCKSYRSQTKGSNLAISTEPGSTDKQKALMSAKSGKIEYLSRQSCISSFGMSIDNGRQGPSLGGSQPLGSVPQNSVTCTKGLSFCALKHTTFHHPWAGS